MRLLLNVLFFGSIVFAPWWVSFVLALPLLFYFRAYEVLAGALLADILYGAPLAALGGFHYLSTAAALAVLLFGEYSKRFLSFYAHR